MRQLLLWLSLFVSATMTAQNDKIVINEIDSLNSLAQDYYDNNNFADAFNYFNESLKLSDSINDNYGRSTSNLSLGNIYHYMKQFEEAEGYFLESIKQAKRINDNYLISNAYLSLGDLQKEKGNYENVIAYYTKALKYAERPEVYDGDNIDKREDMLLKIHLNLTDTYISGGLIDEAFKYLLRAKNNIEKLPYDANMQAKYLFIEGKHFKDKLSFNTANMRFNRAISVLETDRKENNATHSLLLSEIYKTLADSYIELEKDRKALTALKKYNEIKDEFINEERIRQDNIAKSKFFIADYKHAAVLANEQRELQVEVAEKIKQFSVFTTLAALILFILILFIFKNFKSNLKLNSILKMRNEQLEVAKKQVEASSALKTKFISNITHELRTPLYGVVGLSSLLLDSDNMSERDKKHLKSIKFSGDYLLELVNDVLQMGKIESNTIELKHVSTDIRHMLESITNSFHNRLQETNNKLQLNIDSTIPQYVDCDRVRLTQVLVNLVGNSIKFTQNGDISINVKNVQTKDGKIITLRFEVEDNGAGISKKNQKKIFQNFTQISDIFNINYQGTGLGLPIAKSLVELFGSKIELDSTLGKGSTFSFNVNLAISEINKSNVHLNEKSDSRNITLNGNCKILIVEDNKINQVVTKNLLEKEKFEYAIANNGSEALEIMKKEKFDLILMDINMPVMGGNETTQKIREFNTDIPIIALTASDIEEVNRDCRSIGYNDIITKPFDNYKFFQVIITRIQESKIKKSNEPFNMALVS